MYWRVARALLASVVALLMRVSKKSRRTAVRGGNCEAVRQLQAYGLSLLRFAGMVVRATLRNPYWASSPAALIRPLGRMASTPRRSAQISLNLKKPRWTRRGGTELFSEAARGRPVRGCERNFVQRQRRPGTPSALASQQSDLGRSAWALLWRRGATRRRRGAARWRRGAACWRGGATRWRAVSVLGIALLVAALGAALLVTSLAGLLLRSGILAVVPSIITAISPRGLRIRRCRDHHASAREQR
jgi:hypothetical protein